MNLTDRERELIEIAKEETLLLIPEIIGNLMTQHMSLSKMNSEFYAKYPELRDHKELVASVIEMVDGKNPGIKYERLLAKAEPEIRRRIGAIKGLNMDSIPNKADLNLSSGSLEAERDKDPHGKI